MRATRERRTSEEHKARSIALQTFINIQKTNADSVVFVSFSFYPLQTSQLLQQCVQILEENYC